MIFVKKLFTSTRETTLEEKPNFRAGRPKARSNAVKPPQSIMAVVREEDEDDYVRQKYLILGCAEVGKRTMFHQIIQAIDNDNCYDSKWLDTTLKSAIHYQIVECMVNVIQCMSRDCVQFMSVENEDTARWIVKLYECDNGNWSYDMKLHLSLVKLLLDMQFRKCIDVYYNEARLPDGFKYFLNNLERVNPETFCVTHMDNIHVRVKTIGSKRSSLYYRGKNVELILAGGHASERVKWATHFENVRSVLFAVSLSDFDQKYNEEYNDSNQMLTSLSVFEDVARNIMFHNQTIALVFTKWDIFQTKYQEICLNKSFEDYDPSIYDTPEMALSFISQKFMMTFLKHRMDLEKLIIVHTNALDQKNVVEIFDQIFRKANNLQS